MLIVFSLFVIRLKLLLLYIEFGYIVFAAVPKTLSEIWCTTNWHSSTYYNYLEFSIFPATFSVVTFRTEHNGKCKSKSRTLQCYELSLKTVWIFFLSSSFAQFGSCSCIWTDSSVLRISIYIWDMGQVVVLWKCFCFSYRLACTKSMPRLI